MERRKRLVVMLSLLFGIILLSSACHKKKVAAAPPAPPPAPAPAPPPAPTASLTAEPATIEKGQSATLSWNTSNATSVDIEPNVGTVQATGSTSVTPDDSTTYVLTATGAGGNTTASARVTVTQPPPPPPPPPAPTMSESEIVDTSMKDAYFDFDKSDIRADAQEALTTDADFLKAHPDIHVTIEGDCDDRGSEEYNLGLGDRRATSAKKFLLNLGVPEDHLYTISFGKDRPQCTDETEECWQKNRRVHFKFGQETR